jgi:hypothetical protein
MCEVRSKKNDEEPKRKRKKKYSGQQQKEIDFDEPHLAPNEKTQPIRWTERPTGALVAVNSLCPSSRAFQRYQERNKRNHCLEALNMITKHTNENKGCVNHIVALPFTLKSILRQKKKYQNSCFHLLL